MKIVLIGANGQLGTDLLRVLSQAGNEVIPLLHSSFDVCNAEQVESLLGACKPDLVINTAAFHKVEECEKNSGRAFEVNALGALNLARTCQSHGSVLVHFSTDYVFSGDKRTPYEEFDRPAPLNVYGVSKVAGEHLITQSAERFFVVRTTGLYGYAGSSGKGGNFVETMLKKAAEGGTIRVVNDQTLTPTSTLDLAQAVCQLVETDVFGLYHVTCEGECSWYDFARKIFALHRLEVDLVPAATKDFPSPVKRPAYSVLSKSRLRTVGFTMPTWEASLERYLHGRIEKQQAISAILG
jgi:dTDP-4-dehydrorhamnose reductase